MSTTVAVLISTTLDETSGLARLLDSLTCQTRPVDDVLLVVQQTETKVQEAKEAIFEQYGELLPMRWHITDSRGLSASRNMALINSVSDVSLFCDDDCIYEPSAVEDVAHGFDSNPDLDVISFRVQTPTRPFVGRSRRLKMHTWRSIFQVASPEIALRTERVKRTSIRFDPQFGLGAPCWPSGEENVFLSDAIQAGLRVGHLNYLLARHPMEGSSSTLSHRQLRAKGAMFRRMFGDLGFILLCLFLLRKVAVLPGIPTSVASAIKGFREFEE